jgi:hypothetical protein
MIERRCYANVTQSNCGGRCARYVSQKNMDSALCGNDVGASAGRVTHRPTSGMQSQYPLLLGSRACRTRVRRVLSVNKWHVRSRETASAFDRPTETVGSLISHLGNGRSVVMADLRSVDRLLGAVDPVVGRTGTALFAGCDGRFYSVSSVAATESAAAADVVVVA